MPRRPIPDGRYPIRLERLTHAAPGECNPLASALVPLNVERDPLARDRVPRGSVRDLCAGETTPCAPAPILELWISRLAPARAFLALVRPLLASRHAVLVRSIEFPSPQSLIPASTAQCRASQSRRSESIHRPQPTVPFIICSSPSSESATAGWRLVMSTPSRRQGNHQTCEGDIHENESARC